MDKIVTALFKLKTLCQSLVRIGITASNHEHLCQKFLVAWEMDWEPNTPALMLDPFLCAAIR